MMTLLLDTVKVGADAQHGREQHAPLHVAAKAGMLNTPFAFHKTSDCQNKEWHICPLEWQMEIFKDVLVAFT